MNTDGHGFEERCLKAKQQGNCPDPEWAGSRTDPVRDELARQGEKPSLQSIRSLFPATTGEAAFDENVIQGNIEGLQTVPEVDTGDPFLDLSVKTGLAFIDATFQGDHP